jgi:hypothetical protein
MSKTFKDRKGFSKTQAADKKGKRINKDVEFELTFKGKKKHKVNFAHLPYHFDEEF